MQANIIEEVEALTKKFKIPTLDKTTICVYGITGCGKSALINYLLGNKMKYEKKGIKYFIEKVNKKAIGPNIGNTTISETRSPSSYPWINDQQFFDVPGFFDTRGMAIDVANAWVIKSSLRKGLKIKFVLVVSIDELKSGRGNNFFESITKLQKLFGADFVSAKNSFALVVTKISSEDQNQEVEEILTELIATNSSIIQKNAQQFIKEAIKNKKLYFFRNPNHNNLHSQIQRLSIALNEFPFYTLKNDTNPSISTAALGLLQNTQKDLVQNYNKSMQQLFLKIGAWTDQNMKLNDLKQIDERKNRLTSITNKIGDGDILHFSFINKTLNLQYSVENLKIMFT